MVEIESQFPKPYINKSSILISRGLGLGKDREYAFSLLTSPPVAARFPRPWLQ